MEPPTPGLAVISARAWRDDVGGAQTPLTEDSCLPVLQTGCEASWDSAHSQVRTPEGSHHLVAVTERREGGATFLPPLSQGDGGGGVKPRSLLAEPGATHHATPAKDSVTLRQAAPLPLLSVPL